jgi:hypothetical protein
MPIPAVRYTWEHFDPIHKRRMKTRYKLTREDAIARYGPDATPVPGTEETLMVYGPGEHVPLPQGIQARPPGGVRDQRERRPVRPQVKIIVCGSASFDDRTKVRNALDRLHARREIVLLMHAGNPGPDAHAGEWAGDRGVPLKVFPPTNQRNRHADDDQRRFEMFREGPTGIVAFSGDFFTQDLLEEAEAQGIKPWRPYGP